MIISLVLAALLICAISFSRKLGFEPVYFKNLLRKLDEQRNAKQQASPHTRRFFPKWLRLIARVLVVWLVLATILGSLIYFGAPKTPSEMLSISEPFQSMDSAALPPSRFYVARDGQKLAYREYPALLALGQARGSVVLIHGSSADSRSMHPLAMALQKAQYQVLSLDIRGHGLSINQFGQVKQRYNGKGHIAYIGQLEDDLADAMRHFNSRYATKNHILMGFSSGGGFALRVAGSSIASQFDRFVLLAPFISQNAPTYRPDSGGWVNVGIPRVVGLSILNGFGMTRFNHLIVTKFAVKDPEKTSLTPHYDFSLATNFRPQADYKSNIAAAKSQRISVVVGQADEVFDSAQFSSVFEAAQGQRPVPLRIVKYVGHTPLIVDAQALDTIIQTLTSNY